MNPFADMPLKDLDDNLCNQVKEAREHPLFSHEIPGDVSSLTAVQQMEFLELLAREEAIRLLRSSFRSRRLPIPYDINLPTRILTNSEWQRLLARLPTLFAKWKAEYFLKQVGKTIFPMPDVVEIIIREDFLSEAAIELFPRPEKSNPAPVVSTPAPTVGRAKETGDSSIVRAKAVQGVLDELAKIRPLMKASDDYDSVKKQFPDSTTFKVCDVNPELKSLLENIAGHQQCVKFAIQVVAAKYLRKPNTVEKDWKINKPRKEKHHPSSG
jgi:hypothetical protein